MNALLKFNACRARRMSEAEARAELDRLGFKGGEIVRRTAHYDGKPIYGYPRGRIIGETVVYRFDRTGTRQDGSPYYDRARLTVHFSI